MNQALIAAPSTIAISHANAALVDRAKQCRTMLAVCGSNVLMYRKLRRTPSATSTACLPLLS